MLPAETSLADALQKKWQPCYLKCLGNKESCCIFLLQPTFIWPQCCLRRGATMHPCGMPMVLLAGLVTASPRARMIGVMMSAAAASRGRLTGAGALTQEGGADEKQVNGSNTPVLSSCASG